MVLGLSCIGWLGIDFYLEPAILSLLICFILSETGLFVWLSLFGSAFEGLGFMLAWYEFLYGASIFQILEVEDFERASY